MGGRGGGRSGGLKPRPLTDRDAQLERIRADTVFVPYHWAGPIAANLLTIDALDPISKMPEFKVCACRIERGQGVDPVPEPPMPPGQRPYQPETAPLGDPRPPTAPQGRETAET